MSSRASDGGWRGLQSLWVEIELLKMNKRLYTLHTQQAQRPEIGLGRTRVGTMTEQPVKAGDHVGEEGREGRRAGRLTPLCGRPWKTEMNS